MVLQQRFGVSQRRACTVAGQHRSTQRKPPTRCPAADERVRARLREIARKHPRWGWRKAHDILRREGEAINRKRTQRLWRDEGLRRPAPRKRKRRRGETGELMRAARPDDVWALDFQFDETIDQRRIKLLNIVDEFTREALAMRVGRSCTADDVVAVIDALVADRGAPNHLRMDNGPEMIAWSLKEWCRLAGTGTAYIEPGSPWENPFVESFNGRARDELLNIEEFLDLHDATSRIETWRIEYNTYRPHSALDGLTPAEYADRWITHPQPLS